MAASRRYLSGGEIFLCLLHFVQTVSAVDPGSMWSETPCCSWDGCYDCPSTFCSTNEATCTDTSGTLSSCGGSWCTQGSTSQSMTACMNEFGWEASACATWLQAREYSWTALSFYRGGVILLNRSVFSYNLTQLSSFALYQNDLTEIETGTFADLSNLQTMTISQNRRLQTLGPGAFDGLSSLRTLTLTHNYLISLADGLFAGLSSVSSIDLTGNFLENLPPTAFGTSMTTLQQLNAVDNDLTNIDAALFDRLPNIQYGLFLDENRIHDIGQSFQSIPSLTTLSLEGNDIDTCGSRPFATSTSLLILNLGGAELLTIPADMFEGLTNLEELLLNDGLLTSTPTEALKPVHTTLEILDLSDNSIADIAPGFLNNFTSLVLCDLSHNFITTLEAGTFPGSPPSGLRVDLFNNLITWVSIDAVPVGGCRNVAIQSLQNPTSFECSNEDTFTCNCAFHSIRVSDNVTQRQGCIQRSDVSITGPNNSSFHSCAIAQDSTPSCVSEGACGPDTMGGDAFEIFGFDFSNMSYIPSYVFYADDVSSGCGINQYRGSITCVIPPGSGRVSSVSLRMVIEGSATKEADTLHMSSCYYEYAKPVISSFDGCGVTATGCDRAGGEMISIHGRNFGKIGASFFINGQLCTVSSDRANDTFVMCRVPSLQVYQPYDSLGNVTLNSLTFVQSNLVSTYVQGDFFSYAKCEVGFSQFINASHVTCSQCAPGLYSSSEDSIVCTKCERGSFGSAVQSSACELCPIGTFQASEGQTLCDTCPYGSTSDTLGSASCTDCSFWYIGSPDCDIPVMMICFIFVVFLFVAGIVYFFLSHHRQLMETQHSLTGMLDFQHKVTLAYRRARSTRRMKDKAHRRMMELRSTLLKKQKDIDLVPSHKMPWYISWSSLRMAQDVSRTSIVRPSIVGDLWMGVMRTDSFGRHSIKSSRNFESDEIRVAVKNIKPHRHLINVDLDNETVSRLQRLSEHKNLAYIMGLTRCPLRTSKGSSGPWYVVSEYLECGNISEAIEHHSSAHNTVSWDERLSWCTDIARGLQHLHTNNLVHANLHPGNCLLAFSPVTKKRDPSSEDHRSARSHTGRVATFRHVKLLDTLSLRNMYRQGNAPNPWFESNALNSLELYRCVDSDDDTYDSNEADDLDLRTPGGTHYTGRTPGGTRFASRRRRKSRYRKWHPWLAPELYSYRDKMQSSSRSARVAMDMYSFGIIMAQLYSMRSPDDLDIVPRLILGGNRPTLVADGVAPKGFAALLRKCWRADPSGRPSCAIVRSCLERMIEKKEIVVRAHDSGRMPSIQGADLKNSSRSNHIREPLSFSVVDKSEGIELACIGRDASETLALPLAAATKRALKRKVV